MLQNQRKSAALVALGIFTLAVFACVGSVYYGVVKNRDTIATNNSRIEALDSEIKSAVKEKKPVVEKVVSETGKFSDYRTQKTAFSLIELKSFVEYILFSNSTTSKASFNMKNSEVTYQDTEFANVIKTRKRLKELEQQGMVKNVKNDTISLDQTIYYSSKFNFDVGTVRKFLKSRYKNDRTLSTYYTLIKYDPETDPTLSDSKDSGTGSGSVVKDEKEPLSSEES